MQTLYYRSLRQKALTTLEQTKRGSWLHVTNPSEKELEEIAAQHSLDDNLLRDGIDLYESPRLEHENGITYIYIRYSWPTGKYSSTEPLLIVVAPELLITVARQEVQPISALLQSGDIITTQRNKLLLQILTFVNIGYRQRLNQVTKQIFSTRRRLQQRIVSNDDIIEFIDAEEDLNEFLTALQPYGILLKTLVSGRYFNFHEEDIDLIEDIELSTSELIELSKSRLKTIQNMRDAYSTIAANNLNLIFKRLTSIAIFLAIPTVIGGLYGMNVVLPLETAPYAFWIILGIIGLLVGSFFLLFKRRGWF